MTSPNDFKFQTGDRVVVIFPPPENGKRGIVVGRYGLNDDIIRGEHTVVAVDPWPELMYTVKLSREEDHIISGESELVLASEWDARRSSADSAN